MRRGNLGFHFYKEYYRAFQDNDWKNVINGGDPGRDALKDIQRLNLAITGCAFEACASEFEMLNGISGLQSFDLTTTYPGLLTGSGYNHAAGNIDEEFKIGFYFDYTTGMPAIPGSSVKGLIRSAFPNRRLENVPKEYHGEREKYLAGILDSLRKDSHRSKVPDIDKIDKLEQEIFATGANQARDIFFDAYVVKTGNKKGYFLGDDFITPHKEALKNPIPLKFLKVLPDVVFRFSFRPVEGIMGIGEKVELFKRIILDLGVGAKTNVGYGRFEE